MAYGFSPCKLLSIARLYYLHSDPTNDRGASDGQHKIIAGYLGDGVQV